MTWTILTIVALLAAAMVLFLLEICTPSFGLLAVMGIGALAAAGWLAFGINTVFGVILCIAMVIGAPVYAASLVKLLPKTPIGRRLFLRKARDASGEGTPRTDLYESLVGRTGTAETQLRPAGVIRVDGKRIDALAEGDIIEKGETVKIVKVSGPSPVVRKVAT